MLRAPASPDVEARMKKALYARYPPGRSFAEQYALESRVNASARQNRAIYAAIRLKDGVQVAVKVISKTYPRQLARDEIDALRREALIQIAVSRHPHCVTLLDYFETKKKIYIVMEYMDGGDLLDFLGSRPGSRFTEGDARALLGTLAGTLAWLHGHSICHRDLKPSNVLLVSVPEGTDLVPGSLPGGCLEGYVVKISDFGLSTFLTSAMTTPVGTRSFAAPELLNWSAAASPVAGSSPPTSLGRRQSSTAYSEAVDIWSFGIIMYIVLIGTMPPTPLAFPPFATAPVSNEAKALISALIHPDPAERPSALEYTEPEPVFRPYAVMKIELNGSRRELTREEYGELEEELDSIAEWTLPPQDQGWHDALMGIVQELKKHPKADLFSVPVDPQAHGVPDYFTVIHHPMDLSTVETNLASGIYPEPEMVIDDIRRVFHNCFIYNGKNNWVTDSARTISKLAEDAFIKLNALGMRQ
ncbi:uncharacterized protein AMSG_11730 [Thecamonas trahens ATCC 50062]|uniref:Kinase-like protein n=1 Tax=Thecamonas trahens ATCC 50062 TaxID=461836 RepID=A0A0L0D216_THETB|nr:hypothetical protein AMSG_11730 [Thecamonas trahens ATCC 50062]KNC46246.1 hypothetical protein AMSG_11730 [Thecamonas trahens ATCC 50062]|eukprot:XP_013760753.1 hypothetical protein AMSG_11730 [Thecamonas trahens ATCC 50062]